MAHIQSHHSGADELHNTFLVLLKVHGETIQMWRQDSSNCDAGPKRFKLSCHNVGTHTDLPTPDIRVFTLTESPQMHYDECTFIDQPIHGQVINSQDLVIFMTGPVSSSRKASYALDLFIQGDKNGISGDDLGDSDKENFAEEQFEKIGSSYIYLDPKFSSQGIQRTPIIAKSTHAPVGQMQVEYLIITNPVGFGQASVRPDWLFKRKHLEAGHRGSGSGRRLDLQERLLENTIDSFNYAHRHGADMCELDVLVSADGIPVVYHDFDVDATAAQQSSDELGKFRVQVDQFTVKQLREFHLMSLQDGHGHSYTLNVPKQAETNRPFPTLAEVLDKVDKTCGLNIEIKWPQLLESGKMEAKRFREINDFVDRIIDVVDRHADDRKIVLESFDADLTVMLRLKQNRFPVVFLSQGLTDKYERYVDTRARSIWNGVYFAQAFDLVGIDLISEYYLELGKKLVEFITSHNLAARAWGDMGDGNKILKMLKSYGLQCITYDRVDQMNRD